MELLFEMTCLADVKFACLDTETTGLDPQKGGRICEVALSVSQNGQTLETFSTLVNPAIPMHPDVVAIHGITNEMVATAPTFAEILPRLLSMLDGCVFVGHNTKFDLDFLRAETDACGWHLPPYPTLDTLLLARKNGRFERNNLGVVATTLGINADGAHRAMADVQMTQKVLYRFLQQFIQVGVMTLEEVQSYQFKKHPLVRLESAAKLRNDGPLFYNL
ncbi:MAG: 3'-5' exonuclease [Elusimicrobiaceae bacterium]|nr:3'-5' exonuclease [Elusimicrobiaceae bacterium]